MCRRLRHNDQRTTSVLWCRRRRNAEHPIEVTGKKLRDLMSWVDRTITETA
jgi:ketol-acid reductoisomerase